MTKKIATLISYVLHPLMMCTYLMSTILFYESDLIVPAQLRRSAVWTILLVVWLTTYVIPVVSILTLKFTGSVSSLTLRDRKERITPFFFTATFYAITAFMFTSRLSMSPLVNTIFLTVAVIIVITAFITLKWKISAHGAGMGGVTGFLVALKISVPGNDLLVPVAASIFLCGAVISSRLKLGAHTPQQAYAGLALGAVVSFVAVLFFV